MSRLAALAERVWYGDGAGPAAARLALGPAELLFRGVVAARGALYDRGGATAHPLALPAVSVGNLTVGGTGKTPVAAWVAARLLARGAAPALVLRGVGADESRVHALLNPRVPVVEDRDRVRGARRAAALGADLVVLDDAFQHRRAARDLDLVLVSAERAARRVRLLPAGPYREGPGALARASAVVVTRKVAPRAAAEAALAALLRGRPGLVGAVVHLAPDLLRRWPGEGAGAGGAEGAGEAPLGALRGARVLAVAGVGEPGAFVAQLAAAGARVEAAAFPDHHAYDDADVARLARRAAEVDRVVTTLKDAVKLGPRWPRSAPPLWYVSQRVEVERGAAALDGLLDRLLARRPSVALSPAPGHDGRRP